MRVVNIISGKDLGGPKQAFLDYTTLLGKLGFEVHTITRPGAQCVQYLADLPQSQQHSVRYYRSEHSWIQRHAIRQLKQCLNAIQPTLIIAHKQFDLMLLKKAYPNAFLIGIVHGFNAKQTEWADQLIAVSEAVTNWLKARTQTPCITIPNTVQIPEKNAKVTPPEAFPRWEPWLFFAEKNALTT